MLQEGDELTLGREGVRWRVGALIGEGGQGAVFRLESTVEPTHVCAVKWYHERSATTRQRDAIDRLIERGSPGEMFLWPTQAVSLPGRAGFGYVMPLRPDSYRPIGDLLLGRTEAPPSLSLRLCIGLAHAFLLLHVEGLCYRDISFGNVFFDPGTGAPLICDNDNVGVDGDSFSAVLGTRKFMAPEVLRGDALPSANTDLHSLAVLLFYVLVRHHPLLGRLEAANRGKDGETLLLGTRPLFIFDPHDASNRPDPATQPAPIARWPRLPGSLTALFLQSFGEGLGNPTRRVRESVWRAALTRLRNQLHVCGWCAEENLTADGIAARCAACRRVLERPVLLRGERGVVTLNTTTQLTRHHVAHDYDLDTVIGRVMHDPERERWGLRNLGNEPWRFELTGRPSARVLPGQSAALVDGAQLIIERDRFTIDAPGA